MDYERTMRDSYSFEWNEQLTKIVTKAGETFACSNGNNNDNDSGNNNKHGKIVYIGPADVMSIIGFIDASEMKPTFGTSLEDYRCFFKDGWTFLKNKNGDLSNVSSIFKIDTKYFDIKSVTKNDFIIFLGTRNNGGDSDLCDKLTNESKCNMASIDVSVKSKTNDEEKKSGNNDDGDMKIDLRLSCGEANSSICAQIGALSPKLCKCYQGK